jgi:hypothetical protein
MGQSRWNIYNNSKFFNLVLFFFFFEAGLRKENPRCHLIGLHPFGGKFVSLTTSGPQIGTKTTARFG